MERLMELSRQARHAHAELDGLRWAIPHPAFRAVQELMRRAEDTCSWYAVELNLLRAQVAGLAERLSILEKDCGDSGKRSAAERRK